MTLTTINPINEQITKLKQQQQSCTTLLLDCLKVRDNHPDQARRLDEIIAQVEKTMAHNADLLARLEAERLYNS